MVDRSLHWLNQNGRVSNESNNQSALNNNFSILQKLNLNEESLQFDINPVLINNNIVTESSINNVSERLQSITFNISEIEKQKIKIKEFVNENNSLNKNFNIKFSCNKSNINENIDFYNIINYKNEINNKIFEKLEDKFYNFLSNKNSHEYFINLLKNKNDKIKNINEKIINSINSLNIITKNNFSFIEKTKEYIVKVEDDSFSKCCSYYIDNFFTNEQIKSLKNINSNKLKNKNKSLFISNKSNNFISDYLLIDTNGLIETGRYSANSLILQCFVNLTRGNTFLMPNVLDFNNNEYKNEIKFKINEEKIITSEVLGLNLFKLSNENIVEFKSLKESGYFDQNKIYNLTDDFYFPSILTKRDFLTRNIIEDYKSELNSLINLLMSYLISKVSNGSIERDFLNEFNINIQEFFNFILGFENFNKNKINNNKLLDLINERNFTNILCNRNFFNFNKNSSCFKINQLSNITSENIDFNYKFLDDIYNKLIFNENELITLTNNIINRVKNNIVKNEEIDFEFANEIINNIRNSTNDNIQNNFCSVDYENISILNKENKLFSIFFNELDENNYNSKTSLIYRKNINGSNFNSMSYEEIINNNFSNDIKEFNLNLHQYYVKTNPLNNFNSSSKLFYSVIKDVFEKRSNINLLDKNRVLLQSLYLNYFTNENLDDDKKKIVIKRFIEKSIINSSNSTNVLKNSNNTKYKYKIKDIKKEDFDLSDKDEINNYLTKIIDSNPNAKSIKNSVFSIENINSLQDKFFIKANGDFFVYNYDDYDAEDNRRLCFKIKQSILPYVNIDEIVFINDDKFKLKYNKKTISVFDRNRIRTISDINDNENYYIDKDFFDITSDDKVKIKLCVDDNVINEHNDNFIIIDDNFDSLFFTNSLFNSISNNIQQLLYINCKDYNEKVFRNQNDVDTFINNNQQIMDIVFDLIKLYALIDLSVLQQINNYMFIKTVKASDNISDILNRNRFNNKLIMNISSHNNFFEDLNINYNFTREENKINNESINFIIDKYNKIVNKVEQDLYSYTDKKESDNDDLIFPACKSIDNCLNLLILSDYAYNLNYDFIIEYFNHIEKLYSERNIDKITNLKEVLVKNDILKLDDILKDYNIINLYGKIFNLNLNNKILSDIYANNDKVINIDNIKNKQIFNNIKNNYYTINENEKSKFYEIFNKNITSISINNEFIENLNDNDIIKISLNIENENKPNRLYLPIIYTFYPKFEIIKAFNNLVSNSTNIRTMLVAKNNNNENKFYSIFTDSFLDQKNYFEFSEHLYRKFSRELNLTIEESTGIIENLINNSIESVYIDKYLKLIYDININGSEQKTLTEFEQTILNSLSNIECFDLFGYEKQDLESKLSSNFYNEENYIIKMFFKVINNTFNVNSDINKLKEVNNSKVYNLSFDKLYYIDLNDDGTNRNFAQMSDSAKLILSKLNNININESKLDNSFIYEEEDININFVKNIKVEII